MRKLNGWLTLFWIAMIPVSIATGWVNSVQYVSALSLWALVAGHWSTWQAARIEVAQQRESQERADHPVEDKVVKALVDRTDVEAVEGEDVGAAAAATTDLGGFTVVVEEEAGHTVAHVRGEIDVATCGRLRDAIEPHLGPGQRVVLDLSGVSFMDSSCLTVLLQARTTLTADGGSLILRNPSDVARRLLSLTGLAELFDIESAH